MKNVLYDVEWQKLRVSCLASNHPQGGFTSAAGVKDNLERLNQYVFAAQDIHPEFEIRIWRVLNLMNATRMGYSGQQLAGSEIDQAVETYRNSLQPWYNGSEVVKADRNWDWAKVQTDLEALWRNERYWFTAIWNDLSRRKKVNERRAGSSATQENRPELVRFVDIMRQINEPMHNQPLP